MGVEPAGSVPTPMRPLLALARAAPLCGALLVAGLSSGCAEPPASGADAGSDAPSPSRAPSPPAPPASPTLTPCPSGWTESALGGAAVCAPFGDAPVPDCDPYEVTLVGHPAASACQPLSPCPAGEWPEGAPADAVYARPGAIDGNGTRERPFGTLGAALASARSAARPIILGEGEFVESNQISGVPSIVGLCPERTRIRDPGTDMSAPLIVREGALELRGVSVDGALYGLWLTRGANVIAHGLSARGASAAIRLDGGSSLEADRVRAERAPSFAVEDGTLYLGPEAVLTLREATILGGGSGVYGYRRSADPPDAHSSVTLEDTVIRDTPVALAGRIDVALHRGAITRVGVGAVTISPRTTELLDVHASEVGLARLGGTAESAFVSAVGGTTTLRRVTISGVERGTAVSALGRISPDARVIAEDLVIGGVAGTIAVLATDGATIELTRALVADVGGTAIQGESGNLTLRDVTVRATRIEGLFGDAVAARGGTTAIERLAAEPARYGLILLDGASCIVEDLQIEGGRGVGVQCAPDAGCSDAAPMLVLDRARIHAVSRFGVAVVAARAELRDLDVEGVDALPDEATPGMGVFAGFGGGVVGARIRIRDVGGAGLFALESSTLEATSLEVEGTRVRTCEGCPAAYGDGIVCADRGLLVLSELSVRGSARAGVAAAMGCASPVLGAGTIEQNGVGILTDESVDATAFRSLLVRDNGTDYDRTMLSLGAAEVGLSPESL